MSDMPLQTHLLRRGSTYYFRAKVPVDLQPYWGKREEKYSLKTKDPALARRLVRQAAVDFDEKCERLRADLRRRNGEGPIQPITDPLIQAICSLWRQQVLAGDERARAEGMSPEEDDDQRAARQRTSEALKQTLGRSRLDQIEGVLDKFLYLNHLAIRKDPEPYRRLLYRFLQTVTETANQQSQRDAGEVIWTPPVRDIQWPGRSAAERGLSLQAAFEDWKAFDPNRPARTLSDVERVIGEFKDMVSDKPMQAIERTEVIAYRDRCIQKGLSSKTVEKRMALLCALFNVALDNGKLQHNPAQRVTVPRNTGRSRKAFDLDDLKCIFGSPLYTEGLRLGRKTGEAGVWIPLLSLYQGCREEELAQLRVADVACIDGIDCLIIDDNTDEGAEEGTKRLKNRASRRRLPLHPVVIEAGFLDYVATMREQGHNRVFPTLKADADGKYASAFSKAFMAYLRKKLTITDKSKVFHSFRHCFRSACREAGLDEEMADALMGHSHGQRTGRSYGEGFSLPRLHQAVCKLEYPGLVIQTPISSPRRR